MKKLIAILVVFAMVAGAAFAVDLSAEVFGSFKVAEGTTAKDDNDETPDPWVGGGNPRIRLGGSAESEDGKFGGWARLNAGGYGGGVAAWGIVWWKPIDVLKLQIGTNGGDGEFALEGVTGWGYYAMPCEVIIGNGNVWGGGVLSFGEGDEKIGTQFRSAFFGGFNQGTMLTLTPAEGLAINIGIPNFNGGTAEDVYKSTTAQISYAAEGIGTFGFTYVGGVGKKEGKPTPAVAPGTGTTWQDWVDDQEITDEWIQIGDSWYEVDSTGNLSGGVGSLYKDPPSAGSAAKPAAVEALGFSTLYLYAGLGLVEGLSIDIGFGYTLKLDGQQPPMAIGLGLEYSTDSFGVKFRGMTELGANEEYGFGGRTPYECTSIIADLMPYFKIDDNLNFFLSTGLGMLMTSDDSLMGWHVQPYIVVGNQWSAAFYAGFRLESPIVAPDADSVINWSIPLGITMSF